MRYNTKEWTVIDWTVEREEFFKNAIYSFEELMLKINNFFTDKDNVLKIIDSGQKFLT